MSRFFWCWPRSVALFLIPGTAFYLPDSSCGSSVRFFGIVVVLAVPENAIRVSLGIARGVWPLFVSPGNLVKTGDVIWKLRQELTELRG